MTTSVLTTSADTPVSTTTTATIQVTKKDKAKITTPYQLQKKVMTFAVQVRNFVERLPKQLALSDDARQLVRSSGALGVHAIQADEAPSKKAFVTNMKICRKEVKEILYWLQLMDRGLSGYTERRRVQLYNEAHDLRRIFTAICRTAAKNS